MSMKSKSIKRLVVLSCAAAVVLGGIGGGFLFHKYQLRRNIAHDRTEGFAAIQQKDYATAIKDFSEYLSRYPGDLQVLKAYIQARPMVGKGDPAQIRDTRDRLRQLVIVDPADIDARRQLMQLYGEIGDDPRSTGAGGGHPAKKSQ